MEYNELRKLAKNKLKEGGEFSKVKVAVLGNYSTQYLVNSVKNNGVLKNLEIDIFEGGFNQLYLDIINPTSGLYLFKPDFLLLALDSKSLKNDFHKLPSEAKKSFAFNYLEELKNSINILSKKIEVKILISNLIEEFDDIFNFISLKQPDSFSHQISLINYGLIELVTNYDFVFSLDVKGLAVGYKGRVYSNQLFVNTSQPYDLNFIPVVSKHFVDFILTLKGSFSKCLILDLDNTCWGGVIGDDGLSNIEIGDLGIGKAFTEFQLWAKNLKERGVVLCVCSKNTESIAKEPFEKLDDMVLKLDDISVFVANWNNKADNVKYIQKVLNIGFDSMVFLDDNPAEREIVKSVINDIIVPELPEDPAEYVSYLNQQNLFSTVSYSVLDKDRTEKYKEEAERVKFSHDVDVDSYLKGLEMFGDCSPISNQDIGRVAQLSQRSNQFNLCTVRMSESDVEDYIINPNKIALKIVIKDKFGSYGLIGAVFLQKETDDVFSITNWIMSCRVLKRGVENFTFNVICNLLKLEGVNEIKAEYIATPKNVIVKDHYKDLGFVEGDIPCKYNLDLDKVELLGHFIKEY